MRLRCEHCAETWALHVDHPFIRCPGCGRGPHWAELLPPASDLEMAAKTVPTYTGGG